jgi:hypothetical protein
MLKFVLALVEDFERVGINVLTERHSVDGTKALKHIETLTADELNAIRFDAVFQFIGDENIYVLMNTEEWNTMDEI